MIRMIYKKVMCIVLALTVFMLAGLYACSGQNGNITRLSYGRPSNDILTIKKIEEGKTVITVRIEAGSNADKFEEVIEAEFENIDIVPVYDGGDSETSSYALINNLKTDVAADIFLTKYVRNLEDVAQDYLLDLSSENFTANYNMSLLDECATSDGRIYYLPGPSDVYGIVYDKTMFEKYGWEVPQSYTEFKALIEKINSAGIIVQEYDASGNLKETDYEAFSLSMTDMSTFQILCNTYNYQYIFSGKNNYSWLYDYSEGKVNMADYMQYAAQNMVDIYNDNIYGLEAWNMKPMEVRSRLYNEYSTAMILGTQNAYKYAEEYAPDAGQTHEYGMFPFWISDEENGDYLYAIPSYYIAVNKNVLKTQKEEAVTRILEYISSTECQQKLLQDTNQISSINGVKTAVNEFMDGIAETLDEGRVINNFYYVKDDTEAVVEQKLKDTLPDLVTGRITAKQWLQGGDEARQEVFEGVEKQYEVYGTCKSNLTVFETALLVGKMYREQTGAQISLVLAGTYSHGISGKLYKGDINDLSIQYISPEKSQCTDDNIHTIEVAHIKGDVILNILESNIKIVDDGETENPYYVASGLQIEYAVWAESGNKVLSCRLPDGTEIDRNAFYDVAYFTGSLGDAVTSYRTLDISWRDCFLAYINSNNKVIDKPKQTTTLIWSE